MLRPVVLAACALAFAGCLAGHASLGPAAGRPFGPHAGPTFDPATFFDGATRGTGTLAVRGRGRRAVRVESRGAWAADSTFRLDQTVWLGDGPPRRRQWQMRRVPGGLASPTLRFAASLTDASGPVALAVRGPRLQIRYRMGPATTMHQTLTLRPDGRSAWNRATVRVLGVPWARLTEEIVRDGPPRPPGPAGPAAQPSQ